MRELMPLGSMARYLGVKSNWLRGEAESGRVPNVRAGDTFLFNPAAVERVLQERANGGALLISPRRTARLLGISEAFLRREVAHDRVPYLKDGSKILLNLEAIRVALLERAEQGAGSEATR